jgi:hypothetical protein
MVGTSHGPAGRSKPCAPSAAGMLTRQVSSDVIMTYAPPGVSSADTLRDPKPQAPRTTHVNSVVHDATGTEVRHKIEAIDHVHPRRHLGSFVGAVG